jgi:hypothetical protein
MCKGKGVRKKEVMIMVSKMEIDKEWEIVDRRSKVVWDILDYIFEILDRKQLPATVKAYIERRCERVCRKVAEKLGLEFKGFSGSDVEYDETPPTRTYVSIFGTFARENNVVEVVVVEIMVDSWYEDAEIRIRKLESLEKQLSSFFLYKCGGEKNGGRGNSRKNKQDN